MGCGCSIGCCGKQLDVLAPQRKPYRVPRGAAPVPSSSSSSRAGIAEVQRPTLQPVPLAPVQRERRGVATAEPLGGRVSNQLQEEAQHSFHSRRVPHPADAAVLQPTVWGGSTSSKPPAQDVGVRRNLYGGGYATAPAAAVQPSMCQCPPMSAEQAILAEGSQLQGLYIVPWDERDEDVACNFGLGRHNQKTKVFEDADGLLALSDRQREALHAWRRMPEIIRALQGPSVSPTVLESKPASRCIRQGLVGDCSFLSALSALAEYEKHFNDPVLSGIIHPRGDVGGKNCPLYNEYGQYACRLFLNGTCRKVVVDDRVPVRTNGQLLCAHSATVRELWVTLLEKSFAKIMGSSYDMQGSNPGVDIFHLTGWVPETVPLNGEEEPLRDRCDWNEVFNNAAEGYSTGRCVVCVGTSELHDAVPDAEAGRLGHIEGVSTSTGLVARHAYPVLDCRHLGGHRLLRLKNPWGRVRWRGPFAPGDPRWKAVKAKAVGARNSNRLISQLLGHDPEHETTDDGHFWIEWEDVLRYFSHLYLCWAPRALGLRRLEVHGRWDPGPHFVRSALPDDTHIVAWNPQFLLRLEQPMAAPSNDAGVGLWVLLSRHVRDRAEISTRYVAAHIYQASSRLCCPDAPLEQGVYSNGECALNKVRTKSMGDAREFVIVVSQHANKAVFNFTLQVYIGVPGTLTPLPPLVRENSSSGAVTGRWTPETAGGCSNNLWHYFQNPQWRIEVPDGGITELVIFVECPKEHSVNVRIFEGGIARPDALRRTESSGPYRQGCCVLRLPSLAAGSYVAVVSTFRPALCGDYRLAWHASQELTVLPQPHPFAVPLEPPLVSSAHWVPQSRSSSFVLRSHHVGGIQASTRTFVSTRLQVGWRSGAHPQLSLLRRRRGVPRDACNGAVDVLGAAPNGSTLTSVSLEPTDCAPQKESYAASYFAFSGASVLLLAELLPGESYLLEVSTPESSEQHGESALYINANAPVAVELLKQSPESHSVERGGAPAGPALTAVSAA